MNCKAEGLVLTVDANLIHKVDTTNPQNLYSMWTVFAKCASSVEQGRRLENLTWRFLNRQRLFEPNPSNPTQATSAPIASKSSFLDQDISCDQRIRELPPLSGSVDSVADDETIELSGDSDPVDIARPYIVRQDSTASNQSNRHFSSDHLEKMVTSIIQEKEPNLTPISAPRTPQVETKPQQPAQISRPDQPCTSRVAPAPSVDAAPSHTSNAPSLATSEGSPAVNVVRGFSPSQPSSLRNQASLDRKASPADAIPEPRASPAAKPVQPKKQPARFALGGSSGDESSPQSLGACQPVTAPKKKMFTVGGSSGEDESPSLKSAMHSSRPSSLLTAQKKQTSFSNQVSMRTFQTSSDQSDSDIDESAIDDDDEDSEWEDSVEESGKSSVDESVTFKRVASKSNLTSQRSLISLMIAGQDDRAKALSNQASHSTPSIPQRSRTMQNMQNVSKMVSSPNDSDDAGLEMKRGTRASNLKPINEIPRSGAQPILTSAPAQRHQAALSPRTTRRNMLATELTESLRRQLLWERQQKSSTANAVLKRRHTSHDVANLKQYPERPYMNKAKDEPNPSSWNQYFNRETHGGYHAQGW